MAIVRMRHAAHGFHHAYSSQEIKDMLKVGWLFDTQKDAKLAGYGVEYAWRDSDGVGDETAGHGQREPETAGLGDESEAGEEVSQAAGKKAPRRKGRGK